MANLLLICLAVFMIAAVDTAWGADTCVGCGTPGTTCESTDLYIKCTKGVSTECFLLATGIVTAYKLLASLKCAGDSVVPSLGLVLAFSCLVYLWNRRQKSI